jgi:hypothetical protein
MNMAKTAAERQRDMRARRSRQRIGNGIAEGERDEGEQRLDIWIRSNSLDALINISDKRKLPLRRALEQLLLEAAKREL